MIKEYCCKNSATNMVDKLITYHFYIDKTLTILK